MSAIRCADEIGWYEPIWKLITTENSLPEDMDVMEEELVHVVLEIIHTVMWFGIIGSDLPAWTVSLLSCIYARVFPSSNHSRYVSAMNCFYCNILFLMLCTGLTGFDGKLFTFACGIVVMVYSQSNVFGDNNYDKL